MTLTEAEILSMQEAAKPLMTWLAENCHPHVKAIVDSETTEILEGLATSQRLARYDAKGSPL
jgi:hypothetical protein